MQKGAVRFDLYLIGGLALCLSLFGAVRTAAEPRILPASVAATLTKAREQMLVDPEAAFATAVVAERQALSIGDPGVRGEALGTARWLGSEALVRSSRPAIALPLANSAGLLARAAGNAKLYGDIQLARGAIFAQQVRPADALRTYQSAHRALLAAGDRRGQAIALQSIASLYLDGRDFDNADRYNRQAEETYSDDDMLALALYNNRANGLYMQERNAAAIQEYSRALRIARERRLTLLEARIMANMINASLGTGEFNRADAYLKRALTLIAQPEGRGARRQVLTAAARLSLGRGEVAAARRWIGPVFDGVDLNDTSAAFREAHVTAYEIYQASADPVLALAHLQALRRLTDEETRLAASTNTALMAARFDFANQELRIARLKADELRASVALERSRARFQRTVLFVVIGGALVIVALLTAGLITIRRSRDQVRMSNAELAESNRALERALAAKTQFLATTSHEIRTPLNGILGMAQVMLADRALAARERERVQVVHNAGVVMRGLIDDILDMAKMESGKLAVSPEPVDLAAMLRDVAQLWIEPARAKGLAFELDLDRAPGWISTDPGRVRQLISNLLSNALKFTSEGVIRLSCSADAGGERLAIAVRDTGIGIPADKHGRIFESFEQADSTTTREYGGTGLGLAICRNLAHALGGEIAVESAPGQGATFTVTLPLVRVAVPVDANTGGDSLLLLEANPIARSMLRALLTPHAGTVVAVPDVPSAIAALDGASRLLIDAGSLGSDVSACIAGLSRIADAAAEHGLAIFVLCKAPDPLMVEWIARHDCFTLIEKPIAGPVLVTRLFPQGRTGELPLASHAA